MAKTAGRFRRDYRAQAAMSEREYADFTTAARAVGMGKGDYIRLAVAERAAKDIRAAARKRKRTEG